MRCSTVRYAIGVNMDTIKTMIKLLQSVDTTSFDIICNNIDGQNWFDLRDEILRKHNQKDAANKWCHCHHKICPTCGGRVWNNSGD